MIIDRYLLKEVLVTLLAVTLVLLLIFLSGRFLRFLVEVAAGALPMSQVFILLALKTVSNLVVVVPLALYLAVLLALSRLYKDNEMAALAACGVGTKRIMSAVFVFALIVSGIVAVLSIQVGPWAERQARQIVERVEAGVQIEGVQAGTFSEAMGGRRVFYVEGIDPAKQVLSNLFVVSRNGDREDIMVSETGYQHLDGETGERFMVMLNGYRYEGVPGQADYSVIEFEKHTVRIREPEVVVVQLGRKEIPTAELWGSTNRRHIAELHWRLSAGLSTLLMALLAVPLSRTNPRQGRYGKLFIAILVYIVYNNLISVGRAWLEKGTVPPEVGLWWVHALLALFIGYLLAQQAGLRWLLTRGRPSPVRA